MLLKKIYI